MHTRIGVGGRMDTLQCAVVLAKLERFDWEIEQRIKIGKQYNRLIDRVGIKRVQQRNDRSSVFAQYTILTENRETIKQRMQDEGIPIAVHYPIPLNEQPAYKHLCCQACTPIAEEVAQKVISLPMGPDLQYSQQSSIHQILQSL